MTGPGCFHAKCDARYFYETIFKTGSRLRPQRTGRVLRSKTFEVRTAITSPHHTVFHMSICDANGNGIICTIVWRRAFAPVTEDERAEDGKHRFRGRSVCLHATRSQRQGNVESKDMCGVCTMHFNCLKRRAQPESASPIPLDKNGAPACLCKCKGSTAAHLNDFHSTQLFFR